jgi:hypothetical protein
MIFNVPQFIDMEDKIVGPLTAKQLGWFALAGVVMLVFWSLLDSTAWLLVSIISLAIAGAFGFYRPYNQTLLEFIISTLLFLFRPKDYMWGRHYDASRVKKITPKKIDKAPENRKVLDESKLDELSQTLDKFKPHS